MTNTKSETIQMVKHVKYALFLIGKSTTFYLNCSHMVSFVTRFLIIKVIVYNYVNKDTAHKYC